MNNSPERFFTASPEYIDSVAMAFDVILAGTSAGKGGYICSRERVWERPGDPVAVISALEMRSLRPEEKGVFGRILDRFARLEPIPDEHHLTRVAITEEGLVETRTYRWSDESLQVANNYTTYPNAVQVHGEGFNPSERSELTQKIDGFREGLYPPTPREAEEFLADLRSFGSATNITK